LGEGIDTIGVGCAVAGVGVVGCHSDEDLCVIGADGCPRAGDLVCHLVVVLSSIKVDGCPKAGDLVCHKAVDLLTIRADGCPKAGDLDYHWGVDFWFIKADKMSSLGANWQGQYRPALACDRRVCLHLSSVAFCQI
jgi:hypothetical protein